MGARTRIMGILNVTPDSFSDGGRYLGTSDAVAHGLRLSADGADLVDVGGESTRPGAGRVPVEQEAERVLPVIARLAAAGIGVSVDTMRAEVAAAAVAAGAVIVNDVSGGLADEAMLPTVARLGVTYVAMHWRAHSDLMQSLSDYADVVVDVRAELSARAQAAIAAGIDPSRLVLDPGLGFAKTAEHNWTLLARLDELSRLGFPLLIGASRKAFLGSLLADSAGAARPATQRDDATVALTTLLAERGVWGVRTHSVRAQRDAVMVVERLRSVAAFPASRVSA